MSSGFFRLILRLSFNINLIFAFYASKLFEGSRFQVV